MADFADIDLDTVGETTFEAGESSFVVEVVDPVADYLATLSEVFDMDALRAFVSRPDFSMRFDAMHAVTGAYAVPILCDVLGAPESAIMNGVPKEDFNGGHPDPNLTYAKELVDVMFAGDDAPDFGAASDGDGDR